ncbi:MAG: MFS transporter, partial [Planctomycetes bacterium]|nr:MFS transporter [Planctomycetota bacterium]
MSADAAPDGHGFAGVIRACRLGMFVQAMVINLTPLLFVQLHGEFGLTWERIGRLVLINFLTQLTVDMAGSRLVRACGLRALCVAAHVAALAGLLLFA